MNDYPESGRTETVEHPMPLNLNAHVRPIAPRENLIGYASVTINNCFAVDGIRVCSGAHGLFINMPSSRDANGKWHDVCKPVTADFRKQLTDAVAEGYETAIEKMQTTLDAAQGTPEKASVTDRLRGNTDKVKKQPAMKTSRRSEQSR